MGSDDQNFLQKAWEKAKTFFHNVFNAKTYIQENAEKFEDIREGFHKAVKSDTADLITEVIPGTWDDATLEAIDKGLQKAEPYLENFIAVNDCLENDTAIKKVACLVEKLRKLDSKQLDEALDNFGIDFLEKMQEDQVGAKPSPDKLRKVIEGEKNARAAAREIMGE